ncbi:MAG: XylR family transcriptional regulator [Planctomycetota bacterium]
MSFDAPAPTESPSRRSVALLIETSNGYSRGLLEGIIAYAKHHGHWSIQLNEQEQGAPPPQWLRSWKGDGIIARIETDAIGRALQALSLPIVDLSAARHLRGIPWADTQDKAISQLAVEHFRERGFDRLCYCGDAGFAWSQARCRHFREFALQAGASFFEHQSVHRYDPGFRWDGHRRAIAGWLKTLPRPAAIMGCNDFQAMALLDVCRDLGILVPEEMAVIGVDNDRLICELSEPSLTSIIPDTYGTGYEAAELLDRMMNGDVIATDEPLLTQPKGVCTRESTDTVAIADLEISRALSYIRRNALANIRVNDILKHSTLSRRALEHRFSKCVGHTPHEEITRVRISRIKSMLAHSRLTVQEIATRAGYEHPEYMAAAFKKATGMTPTQYRQQQQSDDSQAPAANES